MHRQAICRQEAKLGARSSWKELSAGRQGKNGALRSDFEEERQKSCSYFPGWWKRPLLQSRRELSPTFGAAWQHSSGSLQHCRKELLTCKELTSAELWPSCDSSKYSFTVSFLTSFIGPDYTHPDCIKQHLWSCQRRGGGDVGTQGNLEVCWLPPSRPGQISLYRAGMDGTEEASALLLAANTAVQAACCICHWHQFANSTKALQKTSWNFFLMTVNTGLAVFVKPVM